MRRGYLNCHVDTDRGSYPPGTKVREYPASRTFSGFGSALGKIAVSIEGSRYSFEFVPIGSVTWGDISPRQY